MKVKIYETSASGSKLKELMPLPAQQQSKQSIRVKLHPEQKYQRITGIGGSFTESSAYLISQLGEDNQKKIMEAYFGDSGAKYSLTRTHINSCDFSLSQYAYAETPDDYDLKSFDIAHDKKYLIPMIKRAQQVSSDGFGIIASPWTAPPWMKDNNDWVGGKLKDECRESWALYFSKYLSAYKNEGINIWGVTVENEPLGNGNNWESMHYTPKEMTDFVLDYLGPRLASDGWGEIKILGYDQNREHLEEWVDEMYRDETASKFWAGTAVHWYASTFDVFPDALDYAHAKAPDKHIIQSEGCVDAEVPHWRDDAWYWSEEATDWGWDWAPEEDKKYHPKYRPTHRYARDIIGCLNHWVDGWVDWNMVLDRQGGPNWFKNWCVAPVIVDTEADEVYFTPLYYVMSQFSRFIRPGAYRIAMQLEDPDILATAVENPDGSIVLVLFNPGRMDKEIEINLGDKHSHTWIGKQSLQTIIIPS